MTSRHPLKPLVLTPNAPASWPSVSIIHPEFIRMLGGLFPNLKTFDFLSEESVPKNRDLWIFPAGSVQAFTLAWLRSKFPNPLSRPPAIFLWGGEGAKLGYHILHYRNVFRPDDQWVVACEAEKQLLDHWFPGNDRTHVMFHPVAKQFHPVRGLAEKKKLRSRLGLPLNEKLMLYAGRISHQKNLIALLELLEKSPEIRLIVCGDTDSIGIPHLPGSRSVHIPSALIQEMQRRGLSKRVEFRPFQPQAELRMTMQACDYQISLSAHYGEDFGYSIAQGLSCGLKTVLSHWGGHRNWASFEPGNHITYLDLDWSQGAEIGKPVLPKRLALPESGPPENFNRAYQRHLREQLMKAIHQALEGNRCFDDTPAVQVRAELVEFWKEATKKPTPTMFSSATHPLFQKVVEFYQGSI